MDSQDKYTSWVGMLSKKVGTLYAGIDNIISEESFEYAENQILTAGANVKQFTENQLLAAGANVKQVYSEFMQEVLPEFLNDSSEEETPFLEGTGKDYISLCEILEKDGDKKELSKSNSCDGTSVSGLNVVGKEISLEQNHLEVSEKTDIAMTPPSVYEVDPSSDGGTRDQPDLQSPKSVLSEPPYSSAKAGGTAEPEDAKVDSPTFHQVDIGSDGFHECNILKNEVPTDLSKASNDSTGERPSESKSDQINDKDNSLTGMTVTEPLNMMTIRHACLLLARKEMCSASDLKVENPTPQAMNKFPLKKKLEKGWEYIKTAVSEDGHVEFDQPRGKSLEQCMHQQIEPKSNSSDDFCESDWEIV